MVVIAITEMSAVASSPNANGNVEVVRFVCQIGDVRLTGVRLMRSSNGGHFAQPPLRSKGRDTPSVEATITNPI